MEERNTSGPIPWEEPDNREEQDAAHSFEKTLKDVELKGNFYAMEYAPFMMKVFEKFSLYTPHETTATGGTELTRLRSELEQEREKVERAFIAGRSKTSWQQFQEYEKEILEEKTGTIKRCECELFVEKYFGLSPQTKETYLIKTDYGQLVNLLAMFRDKIKNNQLKFFKKGNSI